MLSTGLQWADFSTSGVISSLLGKMSWLVEVHVAQRFEEKEKKKPRSRKGGVTWVRRGESTTVDLGFFSLSPAVTSNYICAQLNVHSSKTSFFPDTVVLKCPMSIMKAEGNSPLSHCLSFYIWKQPNIYTHQSLCWIEYFRVMLLSTEHQAQAHV